MSEAEKLAISSASWWARLTTCWSNSIPDESKRCGRRIWLPINWGGCCHRCMREAVANAGH